MPEPDPAAALRAVLDAHSGPLFPALDAASPAQCAATVTGKTLLAWARASEAEEHIPETTYTLYRRFSTTGERRPYERPYFDKRTRLTREVTAAWLGEDDTHIDRINDLVWDICEETTWVVPAHEREAWHIDLFSAETGVELAHAVALLGERLPEEIRQRVRAEVKTRILDNYLEHGSGHWWDKGHNNWTGVCAGSIGQTFLLLEDDPERQARALALVLEQLERFIEKGFEEDGGCLEGIGYWNYGLIRYAGFAEMLRARTDGAIDLLAQEKIRAIARYPLAVSLGGGKYASFSDASENSSVRPFLAAKLAERTGADGLLGLMGVPNSWRLGTVLRNLLWCGDRAAEPPPLENIVLPVSGIARLVGQTGGNTLALAVKAGHNAEPHNQNDVGSFVLCVDGTVYLCDPGPGLYSKEYFSATRYENVFANSYGHSVPRIGGTLQHPGRAYGGAMEKTAETTVRITFHEAYKLPALRQAARTVTVAGGVVTLEDAFRFDGAGLEVEEAFMTWQDVDVTGSVARVKTGAGLLEIRADAGEFTAERLEEACKANKKDGLLTRITVTYPPAPELKTRFAMSFHPAG